MDKLGSKNEYLKRIHKVQDYIESHLCDPITIEVLAEVAGFSKYHFHRIFKGIIGEPLYHYVNRLKLESAVGILVACPHKSITDIGYGYGYGDSAVFSRVFKNHYGMSPREFRNHYSKNCKEPYTVSQYNEWVPDTSYERQNNRVKGAIEVVEIR